MKKGYLGIGAAVFAFLIWACGDGSIEPVTDDELLMVGKWDPDIVDIQEACDACLADPECKKEYDKFAKKHGCVPMVDSSGEIGWDEDGDGEIDNWGDDSGLPNFKLSSSSKADDEEDGDDEGVSSDSEEDELSSASRHSSSSAPVYSAASVSSEDDEDDPVVREKSSSSKASGTTSSSSAIAYSAASAASGDDEDDPNLPPESRSSSSKAGGKSSSSSAIVYSAASAASGDDEDDPNLPPESRSSSSKAGGKSSSSSAIAYSATTYSSSDEEENPNNPPVNRSSSSSKPKSSSSSSTPVYVVSSSSSIPSGGSSSSRAARSSSSGVVIETSSVSQSSSSAKSSSSIAPRSSSSKAKSSSSQNSGVSSQSGAVCAEGSLQGKCKVNKASVDEYEPVTWTFIPDEENACVSGDIVWFNLGEGAREEVYNGGTTYTTTFSRASYVREVAFQMGTRRISCDPVTVNLTPPKNCSCSPKLASSSNDLFNGSPVKYDWTVSGCSGEGLSYSWSGTGISGSGASASSSYTSEGSYQPQVRVTTDEGVSATFTCGSAEVKNTPPQNCSCSAAKLTSTSNDLFDVDQVSYSWTVSGCTGNGLTYSWSNGASGSTTSVTGTYTSAGTYTPKVTIKTATNASTTVTCGSAEVNNSGPTGCECESITRESSSNDLLNVSPVVYKWEATGCQGSNLTYTWGGTGISGDGSAIATGSFTAPGSYSPTLRVSTAKGGYTDVQCRSGTVKSTAPSGCSCKISNPSANNDLYQGSPVEYNWSVTGCAGNNLKYSWSGGDVSGSGTSASGSYTSAGRYTPKVTVTNMGGTSTTVTCETATVVNYAPPTCSVDDMSHVYIGSAVSVLPSSLAGCDYDSDGCNYAIDGGTTGGTGDSGYKGGKITGLIGEPNAGDIGSYTLTLTNKIGTGYCNFDVAYADADVVISSKGGSTSVSSGSIVQISSDLTSGVLRCYHGSWQNHNCTVNIESAAMVEQSLGSCQGGSNWGNYIDFPLSSLNADRIAVITFTGVDNGAITCGVQ